MEIDYLSRICTLWEEGRGKGREGLSSSCVCVGQSAVYNGLIVCTCVCVVCAMCCVWEGIINSPLRRTIANGNAQFGDTRLTISIFL